MAAALPEVTCQYEARGGRVEGVGLWGAWDEGLWAQCPDGSRRRLWQAGPPPDPTMSKCGSGNQS